MTLIPDRLKSIVCAQVIFVLSSKILFVISLLLPSALEYFLLFFQYNVVPLHVAARHGRIVSISVLIDAGANLGAATTVCIFIVLTLVLCAMQQFFSLFVIQDFWKIEIHIHLQLTSNWNVFGCFERFCSLQSLLQYSHPPSHSFIHLFIHSFI